MEEENESCGSIQVDQPCSPTHNNRQQNHKLEILNEVLTKLQQMNHQESKSPDFEDQLWLHFNRLPPKYALDVNVERAEDVLMHKRLLRLAQNPANTPVFQVRLVQVHPISYGIAAEAMHLDSSMKEDAQSCFNSSSRLHPPPTFGSPPNLEALMLHANYDVDDRDNAMNSASQLSRPMHEITFSTIDKPKLLSQLTSILSEVGLNIQEAHAFSTVDGFSLDVFVVDGWPNEETEQLTRALEKKISNTKGESSSEQPAPSTIGKNSQTGSEFVSGYLTIPTDGTDVWEIDANLLKFENKVASGSFGDLYKGTYCSQEVAIKVLKSEQVNLDVLREFSQEVFIMRRIRHRNVVQYLGACTQSQNLCIVTEFMSGGSVYNFLHKQRGAFMLPTLLKVAIDVSKGMNYLHQNNIIHRDLKTANLLMDENEVVKVADFGVSRVQAQSGVMTAETGTYRWMAPEVIEHKPYNHKADVFSFGIVLWELLTGEVPYSFMTPLQAAVGVVQQGLRPTIPKLTHPKLTELLECCWQQDPSQRPNFSQILEQLQKISKEVGKNGQDHHKDKSIAGFFSSHRKGHH